MEDQFPFPIMVPVPSLPSSSNPLAFPSGRATSDRQFACAPFFVPSLTSTHSHTPLRLRGGGAGGRPRRNPKAQPATSSRRLEVPSTSRVKTRSSRASPLTDLDKLKIEETAVRSEVARLNLSLRDVEGDGNCLFRALSDQLYGDQKRHPEMRKLTCDYLEAHEEDLGYWAGFCSFLDGENYAAYVKRMRKSGQYASEVEVHAAARLLRRDIRIVHSDHSETIPCAYDPSSVPVATSPPPDTSVETSSEQPDTPSTPGPRRRTRSSTTSLLQTPAAPPPSSPLYASALEQYLPPVRDGRSMLWLALFNDAEHYQSVRRKGDRERGPAEVEDRLALPHEKDRSESARIARGELPAAAAAAPASGKGAPSNASLVLASLPAGHAFTSDHINGILARVKGDIGAAVEILLEEMDTLSDITDETDSDEKVEQMLIDLADEPHPDYETPPEPVVIRDSDYRDPSSSLATHTLPIRPNSPSGSSIVTVNTSESDDASHSSIATTPSSSSLHSTHSKRSSSSGSKSKSAKPYDRPVLFTRRRGKELSKELEELKMGTSAEREGRLETERRKSTEAQGVRRKSQLDELREARERQKIKT